MNKYCKNCKKDRKIKVVEREDFRYEVCSFCGEIIEQEDC